MTRDEHIAWCKQRSVGMGEQAEVAEASAPPENLWGELWLDEKGEAHFQCHVEGIDYERTESAVKKFIALLQDQLQRGRSECPYAANETKSAIDLRGDAP